MTTIRCKAPIGGFFDDRTSWSTGTVPSFGDDVLIDLAGPYTVITSLQRTVHSLTTASGVTLDVTGDSFNVGPLGTLTNAGTIEVHSAFQQLGTLENTGLIEVVGGPTFPPPYSFVI